MYTHKTISEVCLLVGGVLLLIMGILSKIPVMSIVSCNCTVNGIRDSALSTAGTGLITTSMVLIGAGMLTTYFMKRIRTH